MNITVYTILSEFVPMKDRSKREISAQQKAKRKRAELDRNRKIAYRKTAIIFTGICIAVLMILSVPSFWAQICGHTNAVRYEMPNGEIAWAAYTDYHGQYNDYRDYYSLWNNEYITTITVGR